MLDPSKRKFLSLMMERTWDLVRTPQIWLQIEEVAAALLRKKTLSASSVRKLCRETERNSFDDPRLRERLDCLLQEHQANLTAEWELPE